MTLLSEPLATFAKAHAQFAATVLDMARVLLAVEWSGRADYVGDGGYNRCPSCGGVAPDYEHFADAVDDIASGCTVAGHTNSCALDAALKKAGVR
jgi:hypothetical protein